MTGKKIATHLDVIAQWTRAGAGFSAHPAGTSPDLERLLLATARTASGNSRLFIMAASWLCRYGSLIAKHRLKRLIVDELEPHFRPVLGLLLDTVRQWTGASRFNAAIAVCDPADTPRPLFEIECANAAFKRLAEARASDISRRWNLWAPEFEPNLDALRPASWIMRMNPDYQERARLKGDLRSSLLLELKYDPQAGTSESELARRCGAERAAIRAALADLELAGRIERRPEQNRSRVLERRLTPHAA